MKCNVCGAQIVRKEREVMNGFVIFKVECPKCGAQVADDAGFCTVCGFNFGTAAAGRS